MNQQERNSKIYDIIKSIENKISLLNKINSEDIESISLDELLEEEDINIGEIWYKVFNFKDELDDYMLTGDISQKEYISLENLYYGLGGMEGSEGLNDIIDSLSSKNLDEESTIEGIVNIFTDCIEELREMID